MGQELLSRTNVLSDNEDDLTEDPLRPPVKIAKITGRRTNHIEGTHHQRSGGERSQPTFPGWGNWG
jgi:hypothetical protein